ncbi:MAG: 3'-5' exonuclease [Solirubrobacteraceae bacterium]
MIERMDHRGFIDRAFDWFGEVEDAPEGADNRAFVDFAVDKDIWQEIRSAIEGRYGGQALTLAGCLQEVDLSSKEVPIPPTAVRCFTIHNAKGMEFPRVYLLGFGRGCPTVVSGHQRGGPQQRNAGGAAQLLRGDH